MAVRSKNPTETSQRLKELKLRIEKERREIKILEAQLSLHRKRKYKSLKTQEQIKETQRDDIAFDGEGRASKNQRDLTDLLDVLGCCQSNPNNISTDVEIEQRWQDDPISFRLMPLISGICFTFVSPPENLSNNVQEKIVSSAKTKFEMRGHVLPSIGDLQFTAKATVLIQDGGNKSKSGKRKMDSVGKEANIECIEASFHPSSGETQIQDKFFPKEELHELQLLANNTRNLPQIFRNLVTFAEFDSKRSRFLRKVCDRLGHESCVILSACTFRLNMCRNRQKIHETEDSLIQCTTEIQEESNNIKNNLHKEKPESNNNKNLSMVFEWRWCFSHLGKGKDELVLLKCIPDANLTNDGLQNVVSCMGSCEKALSVILRSTFHTNCLLPIVK